MRAVPSVSSRSTPVLRVGEEMGRSRQTAAHKTPFVKLAILYAPRYGLERMARLTRRPRTKTKNPADQLGGGPPGLD